MKKETICIDAWILMILGSFFLSACGGSRGVEQERPNFVFFLSDDHATAATGCYGSDLVQTPNIDRLAAEGVRFDRCFAVESICRPSRTSILTGKYGHITGGTGWNIYDTASHRTFPQYLQEAGYMTALFGKYHIDDHPRGFDDWAILPGQGRYIDPEFITPKGNTTRKGHMSDVVVDLAVGWMESRDSNTPFLLCINDKAVHMPFIPPARWEEHFDDKTIPEPSSLFWDLEHPDHPVSRSDLLIDSLQHWQRGVWGRAPEGLTMEDRRKWIYRVYMEHYLGGVRGIDENVGRFIAYLKDKGLYDNTVIIYGSDQGFFLGEKNLFDKRWMYEPSARMPLVIKFALGSNVQPRAIEDIVLNIDIAPTILDLAGIGVPPDMQGVSLKVFQNADPFHHWRKAMYYRLYVNEYNVPPHYGIRSDRYKLIRFDGSGDPLNKLKEPVCYDHWELYDLQDDPDELINLADSRDHAGILSGLQKDLHSLKSVLGDTIK